MHAVAPTKPNGHLIVKNKIRLSFWNKYRQADILNPLVKTVTYACDTFNIFEDYVKLKQQLQEKKALAKNYKDISDGAITPELTMLLHFYIFYLEWIVFTRNGQQALPEEQNWKNQTNLPSLHHPSPTTPHPRTISTLDEVSG